MFAICRIYCISSKKNVEAQNATYISTLLGYIALLWLVQVDKKNGTC